MEHYVPPYGTERSQARTNHAKLVFQPQYMEHYGNNKAINAMIEIIAIWEYVIIEALHNYSHMYSKLSIPITELRLECRRHKEAFAVYDRISEEWIIKPSESTYKFCYNGQVFEDFTEAKGKITGNRLLLVGKYTKMMQEPNLVTKTATAPSIYGHFVMPSTRLVVGVPGCGKTRHILQNHTVTTRTPTSLILTSCTEGAEDIRLRMSKRFGGQPRDYRSGCRTIDSYLLNSRETYPGVWVDEALMDHPGKLFLVCLYSGCRRLSLVGDPNQLGYINRVNAITLRYNKSTMFFQPTETLNISHRCPVDVMAILSQNYKYEGGAHSASDVLRSLTCKTFTSLNNVPKSGDTKYLVFKQAEKKLMKDAGYENVSTVHEFQGKEAPHVVLVRTSRDLREELYESAPHVLVALSRHRQTFVYYTPVRDKLNILINTQLTHSETKDDANATSFESAEESRSHQKAIYASVRERIVLFVEFYRVVMFWIYYFMDLFKERNVDVYDDENYD